MLGSGHREQEPSPLTWNTSPAAQPGQTAASLRNSLSSRPEASRDTGSREGSCDRVPMGSAARTATVRAEPRPNVSILWPQ